MASITANAPDGAALNIAVPEGTPEELYPAMVEDAVGHYMATKQSGIESFGRAAVNNLPLGGQLGALGTAAIKNEPYSQGMQEFNEQAQAGKAQHPIAYGAGAVTGAVAPLAIPGVGEALEAAPAATGAALGAANAVGNTDIVKQPEEALKQAGEGALTGAVLGKVLPTGAKASEDLEGIANQKAVQSLGLKPGVLGIPKEELEDLGNFAHETGLINGDLESRVGQAADLKQQVGAQIGDIGAGAMPLQDATPFVNELHDKIQESGDIFGAGSNPEAPLYQAGIDKLSQPGLTFDALQKMKTAIGQRAFDAVGEVKNDAAANLYAVYKDAMKSIIKDSPQEYQDAMEQYSKLSDIHNALTNQWQREQASGTTAKGFGMVGKLAGMIGGQNPAVNVGAAAALAPSHPFMALGALTPIATNPQTMSNLARTGAEAIPQAAKGIALTSNDAVSSYLLNTLNTNPQKLGRFAQPLLQAAQTGGSRGLAVQHFLLSQQYPEYNQKVMEQDNENE
jgi:hypothetical protein